MGIFNELERRDPNWSTIIIQIERSESEDETIRKDKHFFKSGNVCPYCGEVLFTTYFPVKKEYGVRVDRKPYYIKRLFRCDKCLKLFSAKPGENFEGGIIIEKSFDDRELFEKNIKKVDRVSISKKREDL